MPVINRVEVRTKNGIELIGVLEPLPHITLSTAKRWAVEVCKRSGTQEAEVLVDYDRYVYRNGVVEKTEPDER